MVEQVLLKRLLLADDDHAVRMMLGKVIGSYGFAVTYAENGKVALELFDSADGAFDLLVTDICMPEMNGSELVREIRKRDKQIPIIAITGYARSALIGEIESCNARLFEKPVDFNALRSHIQLLRQAMECF